MAEIVYVITVGDTRLELNADEARVVIRGDIPTRLAESFAARGVVLPPRGRGLCRFHIEGRQRGIVVLRSETHMRRVA